MQYGQEDVSEVSNMIVFEDINGEVTISEEQNGMKKISVKPKNNAFIPFRECATNYPAELIELIFQTKGADYLCDEVLRDLDSNYVQRDLEEDLTAYFTQQDFKGKRILDFGCGSGASTMILARMFPDSEIVGIELEEKLLKIAKARLDFYQYDNIEFHTSPNGDELPANIGDFDFVIMSAVYEHLLPDERKVIIPKIWSVIKPNGHFFLNMTPHRWFPIEHHTTGLPLLNYFPSKLAYFISRKFSKRTDPNESWEILLRRGIRGATENEILKTLRQTPERPILLEPSQKNLKDRIDLWYSQLNQKNKVALKKMLKTVLKTVRLISGMTLVPNLSLVFRKEKMRLKD